MKPGNFGVAEGGSERQGGGTHADKAATLGSFFPIFFEGAASDARHSFHNSFPVFITDDLTFGFLFRPKNKRI